MKKTNFLWTLLLTSVMSFGQVEPPQNLATNGGFEDWTDGVLDTWSSESGTDISQENTNISEGNSAALFHVNTRTQGRTDFRQDISVVSGTTYTVSVDVYQLDNGARARLYVDGYKSYSNANLVNEWQTLTYEFDATSSTAEIGLRFYDTDDFNTENGSNIVIDNFKVTGDNVVIEPEFTEVATIAELRAGDITGETTYKLIGEAVLTMQQSYRNQKWVEDSSAAILIDDNDGIITSTYNMYDGITGITGILNEHNGVMQFIPTVNAGVVTSAGNMITPQVISVADFNANPDMYESELVLFDNVVTNESGNWATGTSYDFIDQYAAPLNVRTNFYNADYIGEPIPTDIIDIVGIAGEYNGAAQVHPRSSNDLIPNENPCEAPTNIQVTNITENGFTVTWDASESTALAYLVGIVLEGQDPTTGDGYVTTTTSYTVSGLTPNTAYDIAVVTQCGPESVSSPLRTTATTLEEVIIVPVETCVEGAEIIALENFNSSNFPWTNNVESLLFVDPTSNDEGLFIQAASENNPNFSEMTLFGRDLEGESGEIDAMNDDGVFSFIFDEISVANYTDVKLSFDYYVSANSDAGSYIVILDGQDQEAVEFYNDPDSTNGPAVGTIVVDVPAGTETVALRIEGTLNGGSDFIELDNVKLCGVAPVVVDTDEDGIADEEDNCPEAYNPEQADMDNDGQGDACDNDIDGDGILNDDDCDPFDAEITTGNMYYADMDNDGFGDANNSMMACELPEGYVLDNTDCNDDDNSIYPGAEEIANDGIDQDCDGEDLVETTECLEPSNVVITRVATGTAEFTSADDTNARYQGSANLHGRPLRPRPMYGMDNMEIGHTQAVVPVFEYDIWFRTICENGEFSEWVGPYFLPLYEAGEAVAITPNPTQGMVRISNVEAKIKSVHVFDNNGMFLMNVKPNMSNEFNLSKLPTGKYNVKITDAKGNVTLKQVIKK